MTTLTLKRYYVPLNTGLIICACHSPARSRPACGLTFLWIGTTTDIVTAPSNLGRPISDTTSKLRKSANIAGGFMSRPGNSIQGDGNDPRAAGVRRGWSRSTRHRMRRKLKPLPWVCPLDQPQRRLLSWQTPYRLARKILGLASNRYNFCEVGAIKNPFHQFPYSLGGIGRH